MSEQSETRTSKEARERAREAMPSADELTETAKLVKKAGATLLVLRTIQEAPDHLDGDELVEFAANSLEEKHG